MKTANKIAKKSVNDMVIGQQFEWKNARKFNWEGTTYE